MKLSLSKVMEVVEFEPERVMGMVIRDSTPTGPLEMHSRLTLEAAGEGGTALTGYLDIPSMEAPMDPSPIEASLSRMKELIEAETSQRVQGDD